MKVYFDKTDKYTLNFVGRNVDLCNNYDFFGFDYNVADRQKLNKQNIR